MSHIMRSNFTYHDSKTGENRAISERWFRQLADCIGLKPEKDYWPHVDTPQFKEIDMELREALATSAPHILLSGSGSGKTYTVECFRREFPSRVFVVSCNKLDRVNALIDKIAGTAGGSRRRSSLDVRLHMKGHVNGNRPMIIFDEAENLTLTTLQALKAMYDTIGRDCAMVLVGTPQLIRQVERLKKKDKSGIPQFYRRFKAGIRYITPPDRSFGEFLSGGPYTSRFKKPLCIVYENYGELHDFLVPVMREADEMGLPFTEHFFRMKYRLPNNS